MVHRQFDVNYLSSDKAILLLANMLEYNKSNNIRNNINVEFCFHLTIETLNCVDGNAMFYLSWITSRIKTTQRVQPLRNLSDDYSSTMSYSWLILAGFIPAVEPGTRNVNVLEVILVD